MSYPKLVRDKIPSIIEKDGSTCESYIADDKKYEKFLFEKLNEEIKEFNKDKSEEEFADILEVIHAISDFYKFDREKVKDIKIKKAVSRGKFEKRIIVTKVSKK